jgi:short-subunit dehydrogenase
MELRGAVALVTGASGGIGAACASRLSRLGAEVVVSGRDLLRLAELSDTIEASAIAADLAVPGAAQRLADDAREVAGRVDVVVHCAGLGWYGSFNEMPEESVAALLAVNIQAPVTLTRALLPDMLTRGQGHIAFVASIAGWTGVAQEALYAGTKAAVITFAESLRTELSGTGVGVSVVSPGAVATDFFARRGEPYERRVPRPVSTARIADAVVKGIVRERASQIVPRWLGVAPAVRAVAPGAYRALTRRFG